ncbi:hypothetical protein K488DRAFT_49999, partial [Vararia minispora EC-137]
SKALCMSGYTVNGSPITVTTMAPSPPFRPPQQEKRNDLRRNLYVLGLPFDLSKSELSAIFSRFGTVMHCVILATVDNASRRRGFIVMSTHAEAKAAMDAISRTNLRGSIVDVSWAVVQRSQGTRFLDGGDRSAALDTPDTDAVSPSRSLDFSSNQASSTFPACGKPLADVSNKQDFYNLFTRSLQSHTTLLISNLPNLLFSQACDLEPLLYPYGKVEKIERRPTGPSGLFSAVVVYESSSDAEEARNALNGQVYGNNALVVEMIGQPCSMPNLMTRNSSNSSIHSLNPHASPFVYGFSSGVFASAPATCPIKPSDGDYFGMSKPLTDGFSTPLEYPVPVPAHYRSLPTSNAPSRSSSAASWYALLPLDADPSDRLIYHDSGRASNHSPSMLLRVTVGRTSSASSLAIPLPGSDTFLSSTPRFSLHL